MRRFDIAARGAAGDRLMRHRESSTSIVINSLRKLSFVVGLAGAFAASTSPAFAQQLQLLQDTETERALRRYETPLAKAAGLDPSAIHLYLVNDLEVNAFVAEGQNMFVNAGIILYLKRRNELVGVMAHETGHIAAGHLSRDSEAMSKASIPMLASMVLGLAAMVAGAGAAGTAIMGLGQQAAVTQLTAFTYVQEATADQIAVKLLNATHQSPKGLLDVFGRFAREEAMAGFHPPPFATTHPVGQDRIAYLQNLVDASPYRDVPDTPAEEHEFEMIQAKLAGYVLPVDEVFNRYPLSNTSEVARYARAMAYMRKPNFKAALSEIQSLIKDEPQNPYFLEVLGQIYVTMSRPGEGIVAYQTAVDKLPEAPEIRVELAAAQLATEQNALAKPALDNLKIALQQDSEAAGPYAWFEEAQAYSILGNEPMANLATAERYYALNAMPQAAAFASRALHALPPGSTDWQRASDILDMSGARTQRN